MYLGSIVILEEKYTLLFVENLVFFVIRDIGEDYLQVTDV